MTILKPFGVFDKVLYLFWTLATIVLTLWLFLYLNRVQPTYYIDEVFHIPQTIKYCKGNYSEWDPKITTLPALYFITSLILKPFNLCNITWIRSVNLVTSFFNLFLITFITKYLHSIGNETHKERKWMQIALSYNIAFLPPLFFWFFLFYTDVFSVTMVLFMLLLHIRGYFNLAAIPGAVSILVRQTNIVWMLLFAAEYCFDKINWRSKEITKVSHSDGSLINSAKRIWNYLKYQITQEPLAFSKFILSIILDIWMYTLCGIMFLVFLVWNKGIVVGDRDSHKPTIHLPQIFYFSVFSFLFAWPYMIKWSKNFIIDVYKHWIISSFLFALIVITVHNNTLVHPFVLADNRHYVFYFWNKFMNRYVYFKYLLTPLYGFAMYAFYKCISHVNFSKLIAYVCCLFVVLVPQLLLEPRYFIIPYILFRLNLRFPQKWQLVLESITVLVINIAQFSLFVNKTFYWKTSNEPQRISW